MRFDVFYTDADEGHTSLRSTIVDARSETHALKLVRESGFCPTTCTVRSCYPEPQVYEAFELS
jgi:hypothetical protein